MISPSAISHSFSSKSRHDLTIVLAAALWLFFASFSQAEQSSYPTNHVVVYPGVLVSPVTTGAIEKAFTGVDSNVARRFIVVLLKANGGNPEVAADKVYSDWGWQKRYDRVHGKLHTGAMVCFIFVDTGAVTIRGTEDMLKLCSTPKLTEAIAHLIANDLARGDTDMALKIASVAMVCGACPGYSPYSFLETKEVYQIHQMGWFAFWTTLITLAAIFFIHPTSPITLSIKKYLSPNRRRFS